MRACGPNVCCPAPPCLAAGMGKVRPPRFTVMAASWSSGWGADAGGEGSNDGRAAASAGVFVASRDFHGCRRWARQRIPVTGSPARSQRQAGAAQRQRTGAQGGGSG